MSNALRFVGNRGIWPVSWFESKKSIANVVMFSMFVGNVPLIPLFEIYISRAFEKVVKNQFGSESNIDALDISSIYINIGL